MLKLFILTKDIYKTVVFYKLNCCLKDINLSYTNIDVIIDKATLDNSILDNSILDNSILDNSILVYSNKYLKCKLPSKLESENIYIFLIDELDCKSLKDNCIKGRDCDLKPKYKKILYLSLYLKVYFSENETINKKKRFEVKKEIYKKSQDLLISNNLDNYLTKNILAYTGDARHLLYDGKLDDIYFYVDSMLTMHKDHYYILPKGFGFLVYGTIDDYYEWFKEDEYALDLNLEKALNYMLTYPEFAIAIDDLQRIEESYEREAEQKQIAARIKSINNKNLIGKLKNLFINN